MNSVKRVKIPTELLKLARVFPVDLYIVGGYVRNQLLGIEEGDIDLCSSLNIDKLSQIAEKSGFSLKHKNKITGTAKLVFEGKTYDYATFRKEKYGEDKGHRPNEVEFIDDIEEDAKRRDFTINAIYYNINKEVLCDFFNGCNDIKKGIIRAIGEPDDVMQNDGERILRMIRIAGELGFKIDKATMISATKNAGNLYTISVDRLVGELGKILYCDKKYESRVKKSKFMYSLKLLNRMNLWKCFGYDLDRVNYNMVKRVKERFLGLYIDMIDTLNPASVSYFLSKLLKQSSLSQKKISQAINIISGYYDALNRKNNKQYFFKYFDNFEFIYDLLLAKSKNLAQKYQFFYKYIISYHLVIKQKDLKVNAKDLKTCFPSLPQKLYNEVLDDVLSDVFDGKYPNDKDAIMEEIGNKMTIRKK